MSTVGHVSHEVERSLGMSFDLLVRNSRNQLNRLDALAQRLLGLWSSLPGEILVIEPDRVLVGEVVAFEVEKDLGDWLLPAFMAGLRTIRISPGVGAEEILAFATQLGALEIEESSAKRFRDWLWAATTNKLQVGVQRSFVEVMEVLTALEQADEIHHHWHERAQELSNPSSEVGGATRHELDRASKRPEFAQAVDLFVQGSSFRAFEMTPQERALLRQGCDDSSRWALAQLDLVWGSEQMRATVSPARVARDLFDELEHRTTTTLLQKLQTLFSCRDEHDYISEVASALDALFVGGQIALMLPLEDEDCLTEAVLLFPHLEKMQRSLFLSAMLQRFDDEPDPRPVIRVMREVGVNSLRDHLDESLLMGSSATAYSRLLHQLGVAPSLFAAVLDKLGDEEVGAIFETLPEIYWLDAEPRLKSFLLSGSRQAIGRLMPHLLRRKQEGVIPLVMGVMQSSPDLSWTRMTIQLVCEVILEKDLDHAYLSSLVRDRSVALAAREIALKLILEHGSEELVERATKWRISEFFDPPDFRERVKTGRQRLKSGVFSEPTVPDAEVP